ncbi:uncharacterized protein B0H18DRAFT_1115739 [Fomitopsis serialis]|uniref:uncharacterized protein n=1 Tax=Fomitopsis serialis TaxID=139415 RepID=UPI002007594C|nr:uncharacterized protein B0H18DRAFT_1115739 [Neoantrodia serialis]KAH9932481.1 hypothetical protein B0H18DRAFT_1115739 [Neoantrodia serialis]
MPRAASRSKKKTTLQVGGVVAEATPAGENNVSQLEDPGSEETGNSSAATSRLADLERELRALKRAERDAYEHAREQEVSNPTITGPRAAKTQAYKDRVWQPKPRQKREPGEQPADTATKQSSPPTRMQASRSSSDSKAPNGSKTDKQEPEISHADYKTKDPRNTVLGQDQHRERLAAADPSDDGGDLEGSEDESKSTGERSDNEEYESGAEPESEEDFGVQGGHAPSSRKSVKVAEQLAQGSVKVVSKGRNNRRILSDSETEGSDYTPDFLDPAYESPPDHDRGANESEDDVEPPVAEEDDPMNAEEASVHREWKEMIIRRAQRPKLPASRHYSQQAVKARTPSGEEHGNELSQPGPQQATSSNKHSSAMQPPPESISSGEDTGLDLMSRTRPKKPRRTKPTAPAPSDQSIPGPATNAKGHHASRNGTISGSDGDDNESATDAQGLLRAGHVNVWPEDTEVTLNDGNKVAGLNSQKSIKVRTLLKSTIAQELPQALALVNAFPNIGERPKMFLDIFIAGTRRLGTNYSTIAQRLLQDSAYILSLLTLPAKRMCSIRGPWYSACRDAVWEGYGLKAIEHDPEALQIAVQELLLNDQFIFPGKLVNGSYTGLRRNVPFCAEPIINLANLLFIGPKALCPIEDSAFVSSINTGPGATEQAIPQTMAALLATFAGAAIGEGLHGTREALKANEGFNSTQQEAPYRDHLAALSTINPIGRHKILNLIFNEAKIIHIKKSATRTRKATANLLFDPLTAGTDL